MSLEAVLEANTAALLEHSSIMKALMERLAPVGGIASAPGVDKVIKAQKETDSKKSQTAPKSDASSTDTEKSSAVSQTGEAKKSDTPVTTSGAPWIESPATESADAVELKPWHEKTAALFAELNGKAPELAQVQKAVLGINTHCGREQATALLSRFGAQAISPKPDKKGLDAAQYPEVFALALKVLAGRVDATESMVSE